MHHRLRDAVLAVVAVLGCAFPTAAQSAAGPSLDTARDLYVAARYDDALVLLEGLREGTNGAAGSEERLVIDQYRSLCLLALGRMNEAESAIAEVIVHDPLFRPDEYDVSPRLRTTFHEVRQRMLPEIAAREYTEARSAYDRGHYDEAAEAFRRVSLLAADAGGQLDDLKLLAGGFAELAAAAAVPPPDPEPDPEPMPAVDPDRVYSVMDPGITPPVTIRQAVPAVPARVASQVRNEGLLHIVIDETGDVSEVSLRPGLHPIYDQLLMEAARGWKYEPATVDGQPVKFSRMVRIDTGNR